MYAPEYARRSVTLSTMAYAAAVNVPWTTPPVIGHYLVTGGDWRAAVWGAISIPLAMAVWWPFARHHERARLAAARQAAEGATSSSALSQNSA